MGHRFIADWTQGEVLNRVARYFTIIGAVVALHLNVQAQRVDVPVRLGYPTLVIYNGKIVTMDDPSFDARVGTIVQAMAVRDGRILATGTSAEIRALAGPKTRLIDAKGRTVLPGFIHTHEHPTDWVWTEPEALKHALPENNGFIRTRWLTGTAQEQLGQWESALRDMASKAKPGEWLWLSFTWGPEYEYSEELVDQFPKVVTRERVDQIAPNNPVRVRNAWPLQPQNMVNTKGYEEAKKVYSWLGTRRGATEASDPLGRQLEPDVIFQGKTELLGKLLKAEMEIWAAYGITTFGSSPYTYHNFQALSDLDRKGEMPARFAWGYIGPDFSLDTLRYIAGLLGNGTEYLWNIGAWGSAGGSCTTLNADPKVKASEGCAFAPGSPGREIIENIVKSGGRVATMHSGGDKDIDYFLDAILKTSKEIGMSMDQIRAKRHAFDHASGAPRPDQIPIIKNMGMYVSMINTVLWENRTDYDTSFRVKNYGIEYANWAVPRKSVTAAGIMNGFEIDRSLPQKEFFFIYKGMTRFNEKVQKVFGPGERTDRITQLKALTRWGAYYVLRENVLGTLEPGKFADFIVLDRDFLTVPDQDIPKIKVIMSAVGGRIVHLMPDMARENGMSPEGPVTWPTKPLGE